MSRIDCKSVWKIYPQGDVEAVKDLTFTCNDGELLSIVGPSGSGKSSTLRMLAGLEEISRGEILFDGKVVNNMDPAERDVALAFESYALYQRLNVYENIAFPLRAKGVKSGEVDKQVKSIAELLDLLPVLKKNPSSLAGGLQQRISLARALVRRPRVTLLDEPISHMDQRVRHQLRARIRRLHDELDLTTIYVTHDQAEAISLCDRLLVMHQAELQQIGTVEEIRDQPANRFVAHFVGKPAMNFIKGQIQTPRSVFIPTSDGKRVWPLKGVVGTKYVGTEISIGVRPRQIKVYQTKKNENAIPGSIKLKEFKGKETILRINLKGEADREVTAVVSAGRKFDSEETVWLDFSSDSIHLFHKDNPITLEESPEN